jgi:cobalt-precorrin-5B (C1)-methyltransferase
MKHLREGFTTGTAAAAAAKAAVSYLFTGEVPVCVSAPLPGGGRLQVPIADVRREGAGARAVVLKDAGDDPDVTHGAAVECLALPTDGPAEMISLEGGRGVGRVTKPGLPVPVGEAAINPAPRSQILAAAQEARRQGGMETGLSLLIEVPEGERLAAKTLNPRLGIIGGLSILGTGGTVKPYSHKAWTAVIEQSLDLAKSQGLSQICFTTGRRSDRLLMEHLAHLPQHAFIQAGDFFAHAMHAASKRNIRQLVWGVFPGKLFKQAAGLENTHAHHAAMNFSQAARWARKAGIDAAKCRSIEQATTATAAMGIIKDDPKQREFLGGLVQMARRHACAFAKEPVSVDYLVFSLEKELLWDSRQERP